MAGFTIRNACDNRETSMLVCAGIVIAAATKRRN